METKLKGFTPLERKVAAILNPMAEGYPDTGIKGVISDLMKGGCISGYVNELIPTASCVRFYKRYQREIDAMLYEYCSDCGEQPAAILTGWDEHDPLARDDQNMNILAWFGFEEAARRMASAQDIID